MKINQIINEGINEGLVFYAKNPDGTKTYSLVKDAEHLANLEQKYRGAQVQKLDFARQDVQDWLDSRGVNLRRFPPGMETTVGPNQGRPADEPTQPQNVVWRAPGYKPGKGSPFDTSGSTLVKRTNFPAKDDVMAEGDGDHQIRPGMKVSQGTVVKVDGNTVTVKTSNGDLMTMNIHDIDQGVAEGSLELNTPDPVVVIQDLKGNMLDKLNLSVASQKYKLGNPQNIKNQLAHQNYTTVGSYVVVSPMGGQPQDATTQGVAEADNQSSAKTGIYQTDVFGAKAYHAKCMEPNCDWESKRFDRIKQAQAAAEKHAKSHFNQGVAEGDLNEFAPAGRDPGGDDEEPGDDPYKYPKPKAYDRSIDFFGRFEADHFDDEEFDKATGVFKGYWDYDGDMKQIAYFKFDDPEQTGSDDPGMGWYYEPQNESVAEGLNEMDKSAPQPGRDGKVSHSTYGSRDKKGSDYFKGNEAPGKPITKKQMEKDVLDILKKQGVAEGIDDKDYGPELDALKKEFGKFTQHYDRMDQDSAYAAQWRKQNTDRLNREVPDDDGMGDIGDEMGQDDEDSIREGKPKEKEADYGADYQDMVSRVKKLAGLGPLRTVYDPQKRVYKNVPKAEQPKK